MGLRASYQKIVGTYGIFPCFQSCPFFVFGFLWWLRLIFCEFIGKNFCFCYKLQAYLKLI